MNFEQALKLASRPERFQATVYVINTLLLDKGMYSKNEFENLFAEWVMKERKRKRKSTPHGTRYRYVEFGCRCKVCKSANAKYFTTRRAKILERARLKKNGKRNSRSKK